METLIRIITIILNPGFNEAFVFVATSIFWLIMMHRTKRGHLKQMYVELPVIRGAPTGACKIRVDYTGPYNQPAGHHHASTLTAALEAAGYGSEAFRETEFRRMMALQGYTNICITALPQNAMVNTEGS